MKWWPFKVVKGRSDKPRIEIKVEDETKQLQPELISAKVLEQIKKDAEKYIGGPVTNCVVTVPAYFTDNQKSSTMDACTIAGL